MIDDTERAKAAKLIKKHSKRLQQLETEAKEIASAWIDSFADDYSGKILFAIALASSAVVLCADTPILRSKSFIEDVKLGAAIWVDLGEPKEGSK